MSWQLIDSVAVSEQSDWIVRTKLTVAGPQIVFHSKDAPSQELVLMVSPHDKTLRQEPRPLSCSDFYIRGNDFIASFAQESPWPFGYQLNVCRHADLDFQCVEIWLSIQTSLLDSHPQLWVDFQGTEFSKASDSILIGESPNAAVILHPLDLVDCTIVERRSLRPSFRLQAFDRFMEKGVIRRARFLVALSLATIEPEGLHRLQSDFAAMPLPLTS